MMSGLYEGYDRTRRLLNAQELVHAVEEGPDNLLPTEPSSFRCLPLETLPAES